MTILAYAIFVLVVLPVSLVVVITFIPIWIALGIIALVIWSIDEVLG